jgi:hydrogenase/urease accessory protein HupE
MDAITGITAAPRRSAATPGAGSVPPPASAREVLGRAALCAGLLVLATTRPGLAHDPGLSALTVDVQPGRVLAHLVVARREIEPLVAMDTDRDGTVSTGELAAAQPGLRALGAAAVELHDTARGRGASAAGAEVPAVDLDDSDALHLRLAFAAPPIAETRVRVPIIARLALGHRQYVQVRAPGGARVSEHVLDAGSPSFTLGPTAAPRGHGRDVSAFFRLGVEHIVTGYDHLLFLLALLVAGPGLRAAAAIVTSFTVAHSITLGLATFGLVRLAPSIVEPVIAASVLYVGLDNLRARHLTPRWLATFGFGLVHGLGFAGALRDLGVGAAGAPAVLPLAAFNAGVEAGQLAVAAVVLPVVWSALRRPWLHARVATACSALVALAGAAWLLERTLLG